MFEARAKPMLLEAIAQLALVVAIQFASEKCGNIGGLDCMREGFQERRVEGLQSVLALEDQVGGEKLTGASVEASNITELLSSGLQEVRMTMAAENPSFRMVFLIYFSSCDPELAF